jgi:DNA polymerase-3 subunit alpha
VKQTYVSLHQHTEGSFLDGYSSSEAVAKRASELGMTAIAVTDHGEVNQHIKMQNAGQKYGVKILFGMEGYLVDSINRVREESDRQNSHFCVWAENEEGLRNLWTLSSRAYIEGRYYKPLVDWEMLSQLNLNGLIVTDGCMLAYMARYILAGEDDKAVELIGRYIDTFGDDNFFMELHTWQFCAPTGAVVNTKTGQTDFELNADMTKINQGKVRLAKMYDIPLIVVNDAHYACEDEWEHHALVWKMNTSSEDKTDSGRTASWIMTDDEIYYWMDRHHIDRDVVEEAIKNTQRIAQRCNVEIKDGHHLPHMTDSDEKELALFLETIEKGFQKKIVGKGRDQQRYRDAIDMELAVIVPKKFYGYFNTVADYCLWAKHVAKMLVGPARGSAGGSVIAWLMDITEIDPIKYGLLFSRFISESRKDNPDIDLDFPQSRRPEVIQYLIYKYGKDNVAGIGTLSRLKAKGILKDLSRAFGISFDDQAEMTKIIEQVADFDEEEESGLTWNEILTIKGGELAPWAKRYPELFSKMEDMIGFVRQSSSHASGILVSDVPLYGVMPLRIKGKSEFPVTQFENSETEGDHEVGWLGFEKLDILGLRHLDTLADCRDIIEKRHGIELDFYDWTDEQYSDPAIWTEPNKGDTLGLFQIETPSAAKTTSKFNIKNERDVAALISVNRPGVIDAGMLEPFLRRRAGKENVSTPHQMMTDVLGETFGICVYQEQIMKLVQVTAGYTPTEADDIRKIMGKKLMDRMKALKVEFAGKCAGNPEFVALLRRGERAEDVAEKIWDNIEPSGRYAFNLSHAQAYAFITCWEAWLRHYYPAEFMTALMRTDPDKIPAYVTWAKRHDINILPPDINDSEDKFVLTDEGVRYGLTSVMSVGEKSYTEIAEKRPFESFDDLMSRISKNGFNSRVGENLISIGALDRFDSRTVMLAKFFTLRKLPDRPIPNFWDDEVVGKLEKSLVGSYITKHPVDKYIQIIEEECLQNPEVLESLEPKELATIGGLLTRVKPYRTKTGKMMAWLTVEWKGENFDLVIFPERYSAYRYLLVEEKPVIIEVERLARGAQVKDMIRLDRV